MPRNKDLKRLVRTRMRKTGEAYTTARAQIIRKSRSAPANKKTGPATELGATAGMADSVIAEKTGRSWKEWVATLDRHGATEMKHRDVAALLNRTYGLPGWWSQMVTVGYERIKGLRARGQRLDGSYEAGKSRTYSVPVARLFAAWADASTRRKWLDTSGVKVRTATPYKSMRLGWPDGTIVAVGFMPKGAGKSAVALSHTKLPDRATADQLKRYWSERLDALRDVLASR